MLLFAFLLVSSIYFTSSENAPSSSNFDWGYTLLSKLIHLDNKVSILTAQLEDAVKTIANLSDTIETNKQSAGTTYIRWGRTTCPGKAVLVYDGYVAGSDHLKSGTAVNPLCLPKDPDYDKYLSGFQFSGRIYGAEYQTDRYPEWAYLQDHDIPCAVCRIPRTNVLMVPGKTVVMTITS
ncbi:uncharacterized protein LOC132725411 [Ruditapes philippinarum]|uniref:uncharacterized protein LOC132725411 n=1 Tax=Ruditapes philippinarum TaxID=129788 RepID=UPI00295AE799|nr:uncharacterized protein LOC132725411 [Ruditapes philippinarum]